MRLKSLLLFSLFGISFLLVGCQNQTNESNVAEKGKNQDSNLKFNFFSFNKGSTSSSGGVEEKTIGNINKFLELDIGTQLENVRLGGGVSLPIIIQGSYYVYKEPSNVGNVFKAGTSISGGKATITVAKGGSTDLNLEGFNKIITVDLANLVNIDNSWKVIPIPFVKEIGTLEAEGKDSLLNRKLILYFCYPVYNEIDFSIKVPPKGDLNPRSGNDLIVETKGNDGEITYQISGNGYGTTKDEFIVQLSIKPQLGDVKVGEDGSLMLAHEKMSNCGSPVDPYKRNKYPIYLELESESGKVSCSGDNNGNIYDMRVSKGGIYCKITVKMDDTEKIINLKLKTAYTLVKKEEIDNIGVIVDQIG